MLYALYVRKNLSTLDGSQFIDPCQIILMENRCQAGVKTNDFQSKKMNVI